MMVYVVTIGIEFDEDLLYASNVDEVEIRADITTPDECFELFMVIDAVKNMVAGYKNANYITNHIPIKLFLPYVPFARQDRYTTTTGTFSLKIFADILNSFNLDLVKVSDVHSNVAELLINNIDTSKSPSYNRIIKDKQNVVVIAPDAGAEKRAYAFAEKYGIEHVAVCSKRRNAKTGEIIGYSLPQDLPEDKHLIVVDDMCDGGRTFIELAKKLPINRKSLSLIVTHGIFSKGRLINSIVSSSCLYTPPSPPRVIL